MRKPPGYRLHEASGQARCTINQRDYYLGRYGTKASRDRYDTLIGQWLASGRSESFGRVQAELTVLEMVRDYCIYAKGYYGAGRTSPLKKILRAVEPLKELYRDLAVSEFGPQQFKAVREKMIEMDWARSTTNERMKVLLAMFKWTAGEGKIPAAIYDTLKLMAPLKRGRSSARETEPVAPLEESIITATCEHLPKVVADMVKCQLLIGCRPGEICALTPKMIDRTGEVWVANLAEHKNAWRGKTRKLYIGPQCQKILLPYLLRDENECLFRPCDSEAIRRKEQTEQRVTPMNQGNRAGYSKRVRVGREAKVKPGTAYDTESYGKATRRAALLAFPVPEEATAEETKAHKAKYSWSPNRLRHTRGTQLRKLFGAEASQLILGHASLSTTEIYAERDEAAAVALQLKIG